MPVHTQDRSPVGPSLCKPLSYYVPMFVVAWPNGRSIHFQLSRGEYVAIIRSVVWQYFLNGTLYQIKTPPSLSWDSNPANSRYKSCSQRQENGDKYDCDCKRNVIIDSLCYVFRMNDNGRHVSWKKRQGRIKRWWMTYIKDTLLDENVNIQWIHPVQRFMAAQNQNSFKVIDCIPQLSPPTYWSLTILFFFNLNILLRYGCPRLPPGVPHPYSRHWTRAMSSSR